MGGMVLETNMNEIITQVDSQNKIEKSEVRIMQLCNSTLGMCRHDCMWTACPRMPFLWCLSVALWPAMLCSTLKAQPANCSPCSEKELFTVSMVGNQILTSHEHPHDYCCFSHRVFQLDGTQLQNDHNIHVNSISTERTFRRSVGVGIGKDDKIWWWVEAMFWLLEWFSLHFSFSGRQDLLCFFLLFQHHSYKCTLISLCFGIQYNCHIFFHITFFWWIRYAIMGRSLATNICRLSVYIFS